MKARNGAEIKLCFKRWLLLLSFVILISTAGQACDEKPRSPHCSAEISGTLRFIIPGSAGEFREEEPVTITMDEGLYCIQFSAGKFHYTGDLAGRSYTLDATYWINSPQYNFNSSYPLILYTDATKTNGNRATSFKMRLYGKVTISRVSDQPAGKYEGSIMITVSEMP